MPVVEFALDPAAQHRVQVHLPIEQATITVMLNGSILGSLTPEEHLHLFTIISLGPVVITIILYVYLNRSGIWQKMS